MRLLIVWTSLARSSEGGLAFAKGVTAVLSQSGRFEVSVVLPQGVDSREVFGDVPIRLVRTRRCSGPVRILRDFLRIHSWAKRTDAELVLIPHEWAAWAGGRPVVNVVQNILYLHPEGRTLHPIKSRVMRLLSRATARLLTGSIAVSQLAARLWTLETGRDACVLPEGIDPMFAFDPMAKVSGSVLIISGAAPHKNPELAKALSRELAHRGVATEIVMVGVMDVADPAITQHAALSATEFCRALQRAEVVATTSSVESFGLPAFEARACGCSVVAFEGTAMTEWLQDDPMVAAVQSSCLDEWLSAVERGHNSVNARRSAPTTYSWTMLADRWNRTLIELASAQGRGR